MSSKNKETPDQRMRRIRGNRTLLRDLADAHIPVLPTLNKVPVTKAWQRLDTKLSLDELEAEREGCFASKGYYPIHVGSSTNKKTLLNIWNKLQDATPSISLGPADLIVFDADTKGDVDGPSLLLEAFENIGVDISKCPVTQTQSGGLHVYFRNTRRLGCAKLHELNTDVKGVGGQTVAPGAVRDDGKAYTRHPDHPDLIEAYAAGTIPDLPESLDVLLEDARRHAHVRSQDHLIEPLRMTLSKVKTFPDIEGLLDPAIGYDIEALLDKDPEFASLWDFDKDSVADAHDHSKHRWNIVKCLRREWPQMPIQDLVAILLEQEACGDYVGDDKQAPGQFNNYNVARDYIRAPLTYAYADTAAIFQAVEDEMDVDDPAPADEPLAPLSIDRDDRSAETPPPEKPKKAIDAPWARDIHATPRPRVEQLVQGVMTRGEMVVSAGAPGAGKTADKLFLCACIAAGKPYHGRAVKAGAVLYVGSENREEDERRIEALIKHHAFDPNMPLRLFPRQVKLFNVVGKQILSTPTGDEKAIIKLAKETADEAGVPIKYIVIDNLRRIIAPGSSSREEDVVMVMKALERIRDATGATVDIIHHTVREGDRYAGSGAIESYVDSVWFYSGDVEQQTETRGRKPAVRKLRAPIKTITFQKLRLGDKTQALEYGLTGEVVAQDTDDKPIETVVIRELDPTSQAFGAVDEDAPDLGELPPDPKPDDDEAERERRIALRDEVIACVVRNAGSVRGYGKNLHGVKANIVFEELKWLRELRSKYGSKLRRHLEELLCEGQPSITTPTGTFSIGAKTGLGIIFCFLPKLVE